jgi:hypothetical protein
MRRITPCGMPSGLLSGKRLKRVLKLSHQTLDPFFERRDGDLLSCYGISGGGDIPR